MLRGDWWGVKEGGRGVRSLHASVLTRGVNRGKEGPQDLGRKLLPRAASTQVVLQDPGRDWVDRDRGVDGGGWKGGPTVMLGTGSDRELPEISFSAATFFNAAKPDKSSMSALSRTFFLFIVSLKPSSGLLLFVSSVDTSESINSAEKKITN